MTGGTLLLSVVFSAIGFGYFLYGRRQQAVVPLLSGLALMIYPYFIANLWLLIGVGIALSAIPYFWRL